MSCSKRIVGIAAMTLALFASACGGSTGASSVASETGNVAATTAEPNQTQPTEAAAPTAVAEVPATPEPVATIATAALSCVDTAALFVTAGSANPTLAEPQVNGSCDGDVITITANGIPDYTYIETSPGDPREQDLTFVMPYVPTAASEYTDVPLIGPIGVAMHLQDDAASRTPDSLTTPVARRRCSRQRRRCG